MSENLFNSSHKATNDQYREGYDAVFGNKESHVVFPSDKEQDGYRECLVIMILEAQGAEKCQD